MGSSVEQVRRIIGDISHKNLDEFVKSNSFSHEIEELIRGHIHQELTGWMFYRKLAADCSRANISLHGFALLWERSAVECLIDAQWLEKYLVQRGGCCKPIDIEASRFEWPDHPVEPHAPIVEAIAVEKKLLEDLERLCSVAIERKDWALSAVVEARLLRKETRHVKDLVDLLKQVNRVSKNAGHGLFNLDMELRRCQGCMPWEKLNDPENIECCMRTMIENGDESGRSKGRV